MPIAIISACMPNRRMRTIKVQFDIKRNIRYDAYEALTKRMRKHSLWLGVEYNVFPDDNSQAFSEVFELTNDWK